MQETRVRYLGQEDSLEKETGTHSSILVWEIPWTKETGRLSSMGSQKSQIQFSDLTPPPPPTHTTHTHTHTHTYIHTHTNSISHVNFLDTDWLAYEDITNCSSHKGEPPVASLGYMIPILGGRSLVKTWSTWFFCQEMSDFKSLAVVLLLVSVKLLCLSLWFTLDHP